MRIIARKIRSALIRVARVVGNSFRLFLVKFSGNSVTIPWGTNLGMGCKIRSTDGGKISIGENCIIESYVTILAHVGSIKIGPGCYIGQGTIIVAHDNVSIFDHALIAEYVTIRDQEHGMTPENKINESGFTAIPVLIYSDVWIGAKATILKGVTVGIGSIVGAHSLVNRSVDSMTIVAGVPARKIGNRGGR